VGFLSYEEDDIAVLLAVDQSRVSEKTKTDSFSGRNPDPEAPRVWGTVVIISMNAKNEIFKVVWDKSSNFPAPVFPRDFSNS
jgi:hypothetical protein